MQSFLEVTKMIRVVPMVVFVVFAASGREVRGSWVHESGAVFRAGRRRSG